VLDVKFMALPEQTVKLAEIVKLGSAFTLTKTLDVFEQLNVFVMVKK
jgi:hypothetical protein